MWKEIICTTESYYRLTNCNNIFIWSRQWLTYPLFNWTAWFSSRKFRSANKKKTFTDNCLHAEFIWVRRRLAFNINRSERTNKKRTVFLRYIFPLIWMSSSEICCANKCVSFFFSQSNQIALSLSISAHWNCVFVMKKWCLIQFEKCSFELMMMMMKYCCYDQSNRSSGIRICLGILQKHCSSS